MEMPPEATHKQRACCMQNSNVENINALRDAVGSLDMSAGCFGECAKHGEWSNMCIRARVQVK